MPQHQDALQFRSASYPGGGACLCRPVCPEAQRVTKPSRANEAAFDRAVDEVTEVAQRLLDSLVTSADPRDRAEVAAAARERAVKRFAPTG